MPTEQTAGQALLLLGLQRAIDKQDAVHPDGYPATRDGIFLGIHTAIHELEREAVDAWRAGRCKCPKPRCDHHDWQPVADELLDAAAVIMRCWRSIATREANRAAASAPGREASDAAQS